MQQEMGRGVVATLSGVGAWLIPAWGCPVCLSAFAGTMSAFGFGFLASEAVLTPLTVILLGGSLLALGFSAKRRRRYGAVSLGAVAAVCIVGSKFLPAQTWLSYVLSYVGLIGFLGAAIWNMRISGNQPACSSEEETGFSIQPIETKRR